MIAEGTLESRRYTTDLTLLSLQLNILDIILKQFNGAWLNEKFASIVSAQWTGSTYLSKSVSMT